MILDNFLNKESIAHQYEQIRLNNSNKQYERRAEVYRKLPRIEEIDDELAELRFTYMRSRIQKNDSGIQAYKAKTKELTAEKEDLLQAGGYPADYLAPIYSCSECEDTGYVDGRRCSCFNQKLIDNLYIQSNLKKVLAKENFDTFRTDYYSKEPIPGKDFSPYDNICNVLDMLHSYVDAFDTDFANEKILHRNILFYGDTGIGKTFLTNCVAKALLDKGHSVLYLSSNDLFTDIVSNYIMNHVYELEDLYKLVYNCKLLIIDDLGTEITNNLVKTQLFEIINKRILDERSTIISTNCNITELNDRYSQRIVSRLIDNYNIFNILGKNIRYQKRRDSIDM